MLENHDLTKDFEGSQVYRVLAIGEDDNAVGAGQIVVMKVNGVTYKIKTDKKGHATLPINLNPKSYVITASYLKYEICEDLNLLNIQKKFVHYLIDRFSDDFKKLHGRAKNEAII